MKYYISEDGLTVYKVIQPNIDDHGIRWCGMIYEMSLKTGVFLGTNYLDADLHLEISEAKFNTLIKLHEWT
jgi:hypothetical protein